MCARETRNIHTSFHISDCKKCFAGKTKLCRKKNTLQYNCLQPLASAALLAWLSCPQGDALHPCAPKNSCSSLRKTPGVSQRLVRTIILQEKIVPKRWGLQIRFCSTSMLTACKKNAPKPRCFPKTCADNCLAGKNRSKAVGACNLVLQHKHCNNLQDECAKAALFPKDMCGQLSCKKNLSEVVCA